MVGVECQYLIKAAAAFSADYKGDRERREHELFTYLPSIHQAAAKNSNRVIVIEDRRGQSR